MKNLIKNKTIKISLLAMALQLGMESAYAGFQPIPSERRIVHGATYVDDLLAQNSCRLEILDKKGIRVLERIDLKAKDFDQIGRADFTDTTRRISIQFIRISDEYYQVTMSGSKKITADYGPTRTVFSAPRELISELEMGGDAYIDISSVRAFVRLSCD